MTEKNPDAASKLACPEEEIPMGMTPWSSWMKRPGPG